MSRFSELREGYRELGPLRFSLLMGATLAVILTAAGIYAWLSEKIGWPDAYGFRCTGRGCLLSNLTHSPRLLEQAGAYELGLFAFIWFLPTFIFGCLVYAYLKRRRRNRILPLDRDDR